MPAPRTSAPQGTRETTSPTSPPLWARLEAAHDGVLHVVAALGATPFEALARVRRQVAMAADAPARRTRADARLLARTNVGPADDTELDRLARRSVIVLEQLTDRATGGVVAAPEMDERFAESGGYGFVGPRDLAYVVLGLLAGGCDDAAKGALRWLARAQAPEGLWLHRLGAPSRLEPRAVARCDTTAAPVPRGTARRERCRRRPRGMTAAGLPQA